MFHDLKYCVYMTQYYGDKLPHVYIGSSSVDKVMNGYRGSVSSKKYKDIWLQELKENPHLFRTKIIFRCASRKYALWKENKILRRLDAIRNVDMINQSYACVNGFFGRDVSGENSPNYGRKFSDETRRKMSDSKHRITETGETVGQIGARRGVETNKITKDKNYFSQHVKNGHETRKKNGSDITFRKNIAKTFAERNTTKGINNGNSKLVIVFDDIGNIIVSDYKESVCRCLHISMHILNTALQNNGRIRKTHRTNKLFINNKDVLEYTFKLEKDL